MSPGRIIALSVIAAPVMDNRSSFQSVGTHDGFGSCGRGQSCQGSPRWPRPMDGNWRPESARRARSVLGSPRERFWMVGAGIPPEVGHRNQNALANSPGRQALSGYQIIQRTLADGEHLRSFAPAQQQLLFSANWRLLVSIWLRTRRQFHNEPFTFPTC